MRTRWWLVGTLVAAAVVGAWWWAEPDAPVSSDEWPTSSRPPDARAPVTLEGRASGPVDPSLPPSKNRGATDANLKETSFTVRVASQADQAPLEGVAVRWDDTLVGHTNDEGLVSVAASDREEKGSARKPGYLTAWFRRGREKPTEVLLAKARSLHGRVVDAQTGAPVAGVRIRSEWVDWQEGRHDLVDVEQRTDAQGAFVIAGLLEGVAANLVVTHMGFATVERQVLDPTDQILEIRLGAGARIVGTVTDARGQAVPGADVFIVPRGEDGPLQPRRWGGVPADRKARAVTMADGTYEVRGVTTPSLFRVHATTSDKRAGASVEISLREGQDRVRVDVRVAALGSLAVALVDATTGERLARSGQKVSLDVPWNAAADDQRDWPDEHGVARFKEIPAGAHRVFVSSDTHIEPPPVPVRTEAGSEATVTVALAPGVSAHGRIVDGDGKPLEAHVSFWGTHRDVEQRASVMSDEDGRFVLRGIPPTAGTLWVWHDTEGELEWEERVVEGDLGDLVLRGTATIVGRIPAAMRGKTFEAGSLHEGGGWLGEIDVDADGVFRLRDFPEDKPFDVFVSTTGRAPWLLRGITVAAGETKDVGEISFPASIAFRSQLLDADGRPVHGALVETVQWWNNEGVRTDKDGRFVLKHLPEGRCTVRVTPLRGAQWFDDVEISRHTAVDTLQLPRPGSCRISLRSPQGAPLAGMRLSVYRLTKNEKPDWDRRTIVTTDSLGATTFALYPGRYGVNAHDATLKDTPTFDIGSGDTVELKLEGTPQD